MLLDQLKKRIQTKKMVIEEDLGDEIARREQQENNTLKDDKGFKDQSKLQESMSPSKKGQQSPEKTLTVRFDETAAGAKTVK